MRAAASGGAAGRRDGWARRSASSVAYKTLLGPRMAHCFASHACGAAVAMTPRSALLLLLALAPLAAAAFPVDEGRDDYAAETDSYALARDAAAGEDYFPALAEPAEGEFEYERPPAPLPAIVYFAEAPTLAQAPAGPRPLGPSKLANKVSLRPPRH
ncbi:Protein of unknown function, partial [Gryllus bimaculatus]